MRKRDFLLDHIIQKAFIEDLMKSFGWITLCGAMYALSISALGDDRIIAGLSVFGLFLAISTLSFLYVALYLFIPLNDAMYPDDPYWKDEIEKYSGMKRWIEISKVTLAKNKAIYLTTCLGFFLYANLVASFLVAKINV